MAYPYADIIFDTTSSHPYWAAQTVDSGTTFNTAVDSAWGFSRVSLVFTRVPSVGTRLDNVQIDFSIALVAGGVNISELGSTDMANAEGDLDTWWTSQKTFVHPDYTLSQYLWRNLQGYGTKISPIVRTTSRSVPGTGSGARLPDQVASNVTMRSASRRHWGRVYVPGISTGILVSGGQWSSASATSQVGWADTLASNLAGHAGELLLGVGSPKHYGFLQMKQLEVDTVPDIQRRRRANQAAAHAFKP